MGSLANKFVKLGHKLLNSNKFGKEYATFTRDVGEGQDAESLEMSEDLDTLQAWCAPLDFSITEMASGLISEGSKKLYIEAAGWVPQIGDKVSLSGIDFTLIKQLDLLEVQNTDCLYIWEIGV